MKLCVTISFLIQLVSLVWCFSTPLNPQIHTNLLKIHKLAEPKIYFYVQVLPYSWVLAPNKSFFLKILWGLLEQPRCPENVVFLYMCVSRRKKCSFFGNSGCPLFSLNTRFDIHHFALLPTYRSRFLVVQQSSKQSPNLLTI